MHVSCLHQPEYQSVPARQKLAERRVVQCERWEQFAQDHLAQGRLSYNHVHVYTADVAAIGMKQGRHCQRVIGLGHTCQNIKLILYSVQLP